MINMRERWAEGCYGERQGGESPHLSNLNKYPVQNIIQSIIFVTQVAKTNNLVGSPFAKWSPVNRI